jgi:hypothetical protein
MKKVIRFLLINAIFFSATCVLASSHSTLKLAIFENPQPDPSHPETSQELINAYLAGINTAIAVADSQGIHIKEKDFFHLNTLPNIIQQASNVNAWEPDIVMGFSTSNEFLMSKAFFGERLILSVSATDSDISTLPINFYSLGIPDTDAVNAVIKFINDQYQNANLFVTVAAESKESGDFADLLSNIYKNQHPTKRVVESRFLTDDLDNLNLSKYMQGYQKGDVIIVMSMGYNSAIELMNKIAKYLSPIKPIFVTSTDNWGSDTTAQKISSSYDAFRIDTLSGGEDTNEHKVFVDNFVKIYHTAPTDKISYVTYQTVMSFVTALKKYAPPPKLTATKSVLWSYQQALKHNPNWFRPPHYIVYKIEPEKEVYFATLNRS